MKETQVQPIHIFKPGTHTSAAGQQLDFSEDTLRDSAAAYDPAVHEAPIVVGHPRDNAPAYGWIRSLQFNEDGLLAEPDQIDEQFAELVKAGRYKKVSASFYRPDYPGNPKPGVYYLRHVGFLGAQPPALKGLKELSFSAADDEGSVEFSVGAYDLATFFRRLREWLIDKFSREEADQVIPDYLVSNMEDAARVPEPPEPSFAEPTQPEESTMTDDQVKALEKRAADAEAALAAREAQFAEREAALAAVEAERRREKISAKVEQLIADGKVLPAEKARMVAFVEGLPQDSAVEFSEGGEVKKAPLADTFYAMLNAMPKRVEFGEHSGAGNAPEAEDADLTQFSEAAAEYREKRRREGVRISAEQALRAVVNGEHKS